MKIVRCTAAALNQALRDPKNAHECSGVPEAHDSRAGLGTRKMMERLKRPMSLCGASNGTRSRLWEKILCAPASGTACVLGVRIPKRFQPS